MLNKILPTFFCGTAIKITSVINIDTPDTANITVKNPSTVQVVASANMSKEADGVYNYVLQTETSWNEGDYTVTITIVYAGYTSVSQQKFTLIRQE